MVSFRMFSAGEWGTVGMGVDGQVVETWRSDVRL